VSRAEESQPQGYNPGDTRRSSGQTTLTADERSQIAARLRLTPNERLRYLEDMIAFEEMARRARRAP
jgi:hypothetical protein